MQMSKLVVKAMSVLAIVMLTACPPPTASVKGEYYSDTVRGTGYTFSATLTWKFLSTNSGITLSEGSSEMAVVLKGTSTRPPKLKSNVTTLTVYSSKGQAIARGQFPLVEPEPGVYVLADPSKVDAWLAQFADVGSVQLLVDSEDPRAPFQFSLYGGGEELAFTSVGK
ncbi:hypothetical protein CYFUS_007455 [Cystobacter fuscus]|uniref:Lipoprotein n=1 Tax=Cystobacter fuscus TaxID=43 RepID=A0A250JDJ6_9BACT|nr:hypothetical protein [Cystobacter fuscus]ATB41979.1 hypothetical protein CYFUS_007455 [Cystobacter fuscus]